MQLSFEKLPAVSPVCSSFPRFVRDRDQTIKRKGFEEFFPVAAEGGNLVDKIMKRDSYNRSYRPVLSLYFPQLGGSYF